MPPLKEPIVVVKVGGSLLTLPDVSRRVHAVLAQLGERRPLLVSGGGAGADIVRQWQSQHRLTEEDAHWLALRSLSLNESLLQLLLPSVSVTTRSEMEHAWSAGKLPLLAMESFVRQTEPPETPMFPHDWTVTSDSLAAWVATILDAPHLVLLKSCECPPDCDLQSAAQQGAVDSYFPRAAAALCISWVNLRSHPIRMTELQRPSANRSRRE